MNRVPPWAKPPANLSTVEKERPSDPGSFKFRPPGMAGAIGLILREISGSLPSYSAGRCAAARLAADAGLLESHFTALRQLQSLWYSGFIHGL